MTPLIRSGCALWGRVFLVSGLLAWLVGLGLQANDYVWLPPTSAQSQALGEPLADVNARLWAQALGEADEVLDGRRPPREARAWLAEGVPSSVVGGVLALALLGIAVLGLAPLAFLTPIGHGRPKSEPVHSTARAARQDSAAMAEPSFAEALEIAGSAAPAEPASFDHPSMSIHSAEPPENVEKAEPPEQVEQAERAERVLRQLCNDIGRAQQHVLNASLDLKGLNLQDSLGQAREALDRAQTIADKLRA